MRHLIVFVCLVGVFGCKETTKATIDADQLVEESIKASGVNTLDASLLEFDFRDYHYVATRLHGNFELERRSKDSLQTVRDFLGNHGFQRFVNDSLITVSDSLAKVYSASVNSVHYFSVLPYGLDGEAVYKTYLDSIDLNNQSYHKIKITFDEVGGGEDFEDVFVYWINKKTKQIDYLAYSYMEETGVGLRFREAYNERFIDGIRFVDYNNFKPMDSSINLEDLDQSFLENELQLLSKIELKHIKVN